MKEIVDNPYFAKLAPYIFPELSLEEAREVVLSCHDSAEFQQRVMYPASCAVIKHSMTAFTYDGEEYLQDCRPSLFISNHRDITIDAMLLQYVQLSHHRPTSHIVVGSNLFEFPLLAQLSEINKMYGIGRGGTPREYYAVLMDMSRHLRHWVAECGESAWIAQRNGRTKDGLDRTDPALLKMIAASGNRNNVVDSLSAMNIVPLSISYEWEPCGWLKAREVCLSKQGPYKKVPGEDTQSVISGICDFKGRVHLTVCRPLSNDELEATHGDFNAVAALIDSRIAEGYHRWPNQAIAADIRQGKNSSANQYTPAERKAFEDYLAAAEAKYGMGEDFRQTLLDIYCVSVISDQ